MEGAGLVRTHHACELTLERLLVRDPARVLSHLAACPSPPRSPGAAARLQHLSVIPLLSFVPQCSDPVCYSPAHPAPPLLCSPLTLRSGVQLCTVSVV